ncbi:HNH endonuclease family protein [Streptomyces sp. NPDC059398]|uniref:HNH endonuclease family protein n=1 Tax=Streptomyces sp. NPDC059398 TaxID=3346820 RepID=UPI0036B30E0B
MIRTRSALPAAMAVVAALAVGGCKSDDLGSSGAPAGPGGKAAHGSALAAADALTVKGRAPKTGYARKEFGSAWTDTDHNHCPTRDDVLKRDLRDVRYTSGDCQIASGKLVKDPYTGKTISFVRGHSKVDIDHVVALSDAWQKGAQQWDRTKRTALANDPLNLLAVDSSTNRSKGDGDTATWLPGYKPARCGYVARQVAVKKKYALWVTDAEKNAMKRVLSTCPSEKLPTG